MLEQFLNNVKDDTILTRFDYTEIMPTYIFGFSAGPYHRIDSTMGEVPMSVYGMKTSQVLL